MFRSFTRGGFQITFPSNGVTVSVMFSDINYCANRGVRYVEAKTPIEREYAHQECVDAEVAVWDANDRWITREVIQAVTGVELSDDVIARQTPNDVAAIIAYCVQLPR